MLPKHGERAFHIPHSTSRRPPTSKAGYTEGSRRSQAQSEPGARAYRLLLLLPLPHVALSFVV